MDKALVRRGLARSRTEAQTLITAGQVEVDGSNIGKARFLVSDAASLAVHGERPVYVSRAGLKLQAALDAFAISVTDRAALDVGASTGGWTDCLLQRGARHVVALDVGHGQMAASIVEDSRVELREGVNARYVTPADFPDQFDIIVADLSFISLSLVLPALAPLLRPDGDLVCLVKPQFEVGAERLGKNGIVRDAQAQKQAVAKVADASRLVGMDETGRLDSPLLGTNGNQEFLLRLRHGAGTT